MSNEEFDPDVWLCCSCLKEVHVSDVSCTFTDHYVEIVTKCCGDDMAHENGQPVSFDEAIEAIGRRGE